MMFTVILLYGFCWFPIKVFQVLLDFNLISYCSRTQLHTLVTIYFVCHWTAMANSFVNPIIYSFMSRSFRVSLLPSYFHDFHSNIFQIFTLYQLLTKEKR